MQALLQAEAHRASAPVGQLVFALGTMAMGDLNATTFAQAGHVELLRRHGGMNPGTIVTYRNPPPRGRVWEGVMIDDHVIVAAVPRGPRWRSAPDASKAAELFDAGRAAYASVGVEDVPDKRQEAKLVATVWGCELQGRRGVAGAPRVKRAALAALTIDLAMAACTTVELLRQVVGLWTDVLLYRRDAFAVFAEVYRFINKFADDELSMVRTLPGRVQSELLGVACLAPVLEASLRAPVDPALKVSDAAPYGAAVVEGYVGTHAATELWRFRARKGCHAASIGGDAAGNTRGDSVVSEIVEGLPTRERLRFRFGPRRPPHINVGECRARRALWRDLAARPEAHGHRHLVVYDSSATVGAAAKGRSKKGMLRELQLTYPHIIATGCAEGALWCDSERNSADSASRGGPAPVPSPQRAWVAHFLAGDASALQWRFDDTSGHDRYTGMRVGEAKKPGPPRMRGGVDLRVEAQGSAEVAAHRRRLVAELETWLARNEHPLLATLVDDTPALDALLTDYGQHMWDSDRSQHDYAELLNALRKRWPRVNHRLGGAWDIKTAWEQLEPGENRVPVPPVLVRALVTLSVLWEWAEFAALMAVGFEGALRPGDLLHLQRRDLRFPAEHGGDDYVVYVILRHSKTARMRGARWQHVRVASPTVMALLHSVFGHRAREAPLFSYVGAPPQRARRLAALFAAALQVLRVPYGQRRGFVMSGLRAGGTTAYFQCTQRLDLTRWRGRWDNERSMEHYLQELPMGEAYASLPESTRTRVTAVARLLDYVLTEAGLDLAPPRM